MSVRKSASISSTSSPLVRHPQAFVLQQHLDIREPRDALAQHLVHRGLVQELLGRMPKPRALIIVSMNGRPPVSTNATGRSGQHVVLQSVGEPDDWQTRSTSSSVESPGPGRTCRGPGRSQPLQVRAGPTGRPRWRRWARTQSLPRRSVGLHSPTLDPASGLLL